MTINELLLSDDWGWFVDIDIDYESKIQLIQYNRKNFKMNILATIEEDNEFDYYSEELRDLDIEKIQDKNIELIQQKKTLDNIIYRIGSTTLITALFSCFIYFIL